MKSRECETCIKRKTVYCPTSIECMSTDDKPYYQNRIMLLEENQELKKQLEEYKKKLMRITKMEIKQIDEATFVGIDYFQDKCIVLKAQQKEFIKYLEDNWKQTQDIWYIKILQKYKEIIGEIV